MDAVIAWFWIIVLVGGVILFRYLLGKGINTVARTANRKILYRSEYEEGKRIVSEPLIVRTSLPVADIVHEISARVTVAELPLTYKAVLYQAYCNEKGIAYAFGNKFKPQTFLATINFKKTGEETECVFKMAKWWEKEGLITGQPYMEKLKRQIREAFAVLENPALAMETAGAGNVFCPNCGVSNVSTAKFCKDCGNQI